MMPKACGFANAGCRGVAATSGVAGAKPLEFKTLKIVVGSSTGGGYDTYARVLARHMGRHLPGPPGIIVQNMPGAASLKAIQYLDNGAPTDGSVITAFNPAPHGVSRQSRQDRFRFTDVAWIGSITRDLRACYAWAATGIKSFDDLKTYKQFNMGAPTPGTSSYINGGAQEHVRDRGSPRDGICGKRRAATGDRTRRTRRRLRRLEQRSAGMDRQRPDQSAHQLLAGADTGAQAGHVPFAGDLATTQEAKDVLDILMTTDVLGRPFVASRQVPADRLAALRKAFDRTMKDAQFLAEAEKLDLPVAGPISGLEAEKIIASLYAASPALIARTQAITGG